MFIETRDLNLTFGGPKDFHGADLGIEKGHLAAIIGSSGCGASVLLRSLNLLERGVGGFIRMGDVEIYVSDQHAHQACLAQRLRSKAGYVASSCDFVSFRSVIENVMEGLVSVLKKDRQVARQEAAKHLKDIGVGEHVFDMRPLRPSHDTLARARLARALSMNPEVLLIDDIAGAFLGLDISWSECDDRTLLHFDKSYEWLAQALAGMRHRKTIIIRTEDPRILKMADTFIWMEQGSVRGVGSLEYLSSTVGGGRDGWAIEQTVENIARYETLIGTV